jgi:hypothetical protein
MKGCFITVKTAVLLYLFFVVAVMFALFYNWSIPYKRPNEFFKSCGGSCKTSADCAPGMTCEGNQCCA